MNSSQWKVKYPGEATIIKAQFRLEVDLDLKRIDSGL